MKLRIFGIVILGLAVIGALILGGAPVLGASQSGPASPQTNLAAQGTSMPVVTPNPQQTITNATQVQIANFAFGPSSLTVPVGTTVQWTNMDSIAHTVTSDTNLFNSEPLNPGAMFRLTFTQPGTYAYHCSIHPNMTATIVVTAGSANQGATQGAPTAPASGGGYGGGY